jgi:putative oxidoreductase
MLNQTAPLATLILRLALGVLFLAHGLVKLLVYTPAGTAEFFTSVGYPGILAYPVMVVEIGAGLLLILGLGTRWAALSLVPLMLGATAVHWPNGWVFNNSGGGWEFTAFLAVAALTQFLVPDDGPLSAGKLLSRRRHDQAERAPAATVGARAA